MSGEAAGQTTDPVLARFLRSLAARDASPHTQRAYATAVGSYLEWLSARGTVLGQFEDTRFEVGCVKLMPGDLLVLYTDGVTETHSASGAQTEKDVPSTPLTRPGWAPSFS